MDRLFAIFFSINSISNKNFHVIRSLKEQNDTKRLNFRNVNFNGLMTQEIRLELWTVDCQQSELY